MARANVSPHRSSPARRDNSRARLWRASLHTRCSASVARGKSNHRGDISKVSALPNGNRFSNRVLIQASDLPGRLSGKRFDCIVAMDLVDDTNASEFLGIVHELLTPGGEMVSYESNPWNPVHKLRRGLLRLIGKRDPRNLISRSRSAAELLSDIGFVRVYAAYNDFVFAPLNRPLIWLLRNLSILLENAPSCAHWPVRS